MRNYTVTLSIEADGEPEVYRRIKELVGDWRTNWFRIELGDENEPNARGGAKE